MKKIYLLLLVTFTLAAANVAQAEDRRPGWGPGGPGRPGWGPGRPGWGPGGPGRPGWGPGGPGGGHGGPREQPQACFFRGGNYQGEQFCVQDGQEIQNLDRSGWNDAIGSMAVYGGVDAIVCEHANFRGRCSTINAHTPDLSPWGLANQISSIRVVGRHNGGPGWGNPPPPPRERVCFFEDSDFRGRRQVCVGLGEEIRNFADIGFNDAVSSISIPRGLAVQVCVNAYFDRCTTLDARQDLRNLGNIGWNDTISSVRVFR